MEGDHNVHGSRCAAAIAADPIPKVSYINNESEFRSALSAEQMAFDKLHEGIRKFAEDGEALKSLLRERLYK
jgi:transaldolase